MATACAGAWVYIKDIAPNLRSDAAPKGSYAAADYEQRMSRLASSLSEGAKKPAATSSDNNSGPGGSSRNGNPGKATDSPANVNASSIVGAGATNSSSVGNVGNNVNLAFYS